jgi:hypothetical protein
MKTYSALVERRWRELDALQAECSYHDNRATIGRYLPTMRCGNTAAREDKAGHFGIMSEFVRRHDRHVVTSVTSSRSSRRHDRHGIYPI